MERKRKRSLAAGFGIFLLGMAVMTFFARVHYSEQLPKVDWSYAVSSSLQQTIKASGVIGTDSPQLVYGLDGLRVSKICVSVGDRVEEGTPLFEIDTQDLQVQFEKLRLEQENWQQRYDSWYEDARAKTEVFEAGLREERLGLWMEILEQDGKICAEEAGMILEVLIEAGYRMEDVPAMLYADTETPLVFEAVISAQQKEMVHIGDAVTIQFSGSKEEAAAQIDWIEEQSGNYLVTVHLPEGKGQGEMEGTMEMKYSSSVYDYVIPLEALHTEGERSCIYFLEEKSGILGTELSAKKVDVRVLEQSLSHAAIEEEILEDGMKIIVSTDKVLSDGATVREAE